MSDLRRDKQNCNFFFVKNKEIIHAHEVNGCYKFSFNVFIALWYMYEVYACYCKFSVLYTSNVE